MDVGKRSFFRVRRMLTLEGISKYTRPENRQGGNAHAALSADLYQSKNRQGVRFFFGSHTRSLTVGQKLTSTAYVYCISVGRVSIKGLATQKSLFLGQGFELENRSLYKRKVTDKMD